MSKNILSNFILLLQELYNKFKKSFQYGLVTEEIIFIENCLHDITSVINLSDITLFYPSLFEASLFESILFKIKDLNCENNYEDRIKLNNNLPFLLLNSKLRDMGRVCDIVLSSRLPSFAQSKVLNILIYRFEKEHFQKKDVETILQVLLKNAIALEEKNVFLMGSFLKVIFVLGNVFPDVEIQLSIEARTSENLFRNMLFVIQTALTKKISHGENMVKQLLFVERQLVKNISISEEIDIDILSILFYFQKLNFELNKINFCKFVFYFCTNESTYLQAYHFVSFYMTKNFCSILSLLKYFFHPKYLAVFLDNSSIVNLYRDMNRALQKEEANCRENNSFYDTEGDELISYDILNNLIKYFFNQINCS